MPARRLQDQRIQIRLYDVVGQDADDVREFVRHVGLAGIQRDDFHPEDTLTLTHMGPPLERGSDPDRVQATGTIPLTADEINQVRVFVEELAQEYEAGRIHPVRQYVVCPPADEVPGKDGTALIRRFSCAGFVLEAYRDAGIDLLITDPSSVPLVSLETLCSAYSDPVVRRALHDPNKRSHYGLIGDPPWRVVLAGYVLNAMNREADEIRAGPYQPRAGDEYFPPRRAASS